MADEIKPVAWLAEGQGWGRVFISRDAAEKLAAEDGEIRPLYGPEAMAEIERLREHVDHWKVVARGAGVCMTCRGPDGWPEPYGCTDCYNTGRSPEYHNDLIEARAIIERLREENDVLIGQRTAGRQAADTLYDETRRLRQAMERIANCGQSKEPDHWAFRLQAREIASEALASHPLTSTSVDDMEGADISDKLRGVESERDQLREDLAMMATRAKAFEADADRYAAYIRPLKEKTP